MAVFHGQRGTTQHFAGLDGRAKAYLEILDLNVFLTGAAGQLGQCLVATVPAGINLVCTDKLDCDLTDAAALTAALGKAMPDIVINTAAFTAVDKAESQAELAQAVNADAVATIARYCEANSVRLIQISTDFVFDGTTKLGYGPTDEPNPLNVYGRTKRGGEVNALELCERACVVRSSWIYSEFGTNFVKTMLRLADERDHLSVVSDQKGSPTYGFNLARMLWRLTELDDAALLQNPSRILHWADHGYTSRFDFAQEIFATAVRTQAIARRPHVDPILAADYGAPAKRPSFSGLDTSATANLLGITPVEWPDALQAMLANRERQLKLA